MQVSIRTYPLDVVLFSLLTSIAALCGCEGPPPQAENSPPASNPVPTSAPAASKSAAAANNPPTGRGRPWPAANSGIAPAPSAADSGEKQISDAEAQEFAKALETTFKSNDPAVINTAIDYDALVHCAMQGIEVDEQYRQDAIRDMKTFLAGPDGIGAGLATQIAQGARYRLLHIHRDGVRQRALFRRETSDGLDYVDFVLLRNAEGKVLIADIYDYADGGLESEDLHQQALCNAADASPEVLRRLSPIDREYLALRTKIEEMHSLSSAHRFKEVVDLYQGMPAVLKDHHRVLHDYFVASCYLGAECDETIRAYRAACPNDPGSDLILLNHYLLRRRFDDSLACIDRLDKAVGGDPYLDMDRASICLVKGDLATAKKLAQNAAAVEPDLRWPKEFLKTVSLLEKKVPAARPTGSLNLSEAPRGEPARDGEAKTFAEAFAKSMMANDTVAIHAAFDLPAVYHRTIAGIDVSEATRVGIEAAFSNYVGAELSDIFSFSQLLAEKKGSFQLLHLRRVAGEQRALFRLIGSLGGVIYCDCTLMRHADGKVRIDDVYLSTVGTSLSEVMHHLLLLGFDKTGTSPPAANAEPSGDGVKFGMALAEMQKLQTEGQYQAVLDVYDRLPERFQKERLAFQQRINAAKHLKGKPYDDAVRAYQQAFPNEPGMNLILVDAYLEHKLYDRALACIDSIDKAVGGDPYLDVLRARTHRMKGDLAAAKKCAENAVAAEPDNPWVRHCLELVTKADNDAPAKETAGAAKLAASPHGDPAGDEEAKTFAESFAKCVARADMTGIRDGFDTAAAFKRTMDAANIPEEARGAIESQFPTIFDPVIADFFGFGIPAEKGSHFRLLHLRRDNGQQHAVFRQVHANGDATYYDAALVRNSNGKVLIDDVYSFDAAALLSATVSRTIQFALEKLVPTPQSLRTEAEDSAARLAVTTSEMQQRNREGQYQAALDIYAKLPENLQKEKSVLLARVQAASRVKGKPYDEAIRAYRTALPNEPNLDLLMINGYLEHKLYDRALSCIDRLDKTVGGDPYLDTMRAGVCRMKGDRAAAKTYLDQVIAAEPDLQLPYIRLLSISLEEKMYVDTGRLLTTMQKQFPDQMPAVATDPAFADFVKSQQYRNWLQTQRRGGKNGPTRQ